MQRSLERSEMAPDEFFDHLDRSFADQRAAVAALALRTDALAALCEELARTRIAAEGHAVPPSRWTWDVRLPNYIFDDVFEPEPVPGGAKRWVGPSAHVGATLRLPRTVQYDFSVQIEDFASDAAAKSFYLRIDGLQYPWLSHDAASCRVGRYTSVILCDDDLDDLNFEIGVDRASVPPGRGVSFSFRSIDVVRRA